MNTDSLHQEEATLDPQDWTSIRALGHQMLDDMLASAMNANVSLGDHMPMYVERQVIDWAKEMMGFPSTASGILVSGGSLANITALVVARNQFSKDVRKKGMQSISSQLIVYGSAETHNCVIKGVEVVGI